jgi:hypothetical protein
VSLCDSQVIQFAGEVGALDLQAADGSVRDTLYSTNSLNQYTARNPSHKAVRGLALPEAGVQAKTYAPGQSQPEELTPSRNGNECSTEPNVAPGPPPPATTDSNGDACKSKPAASVWARLQRRHRHHPTQRQPPC